MNNEIRVMFVGVGYFSFPTSGEKNFFYWISPLIAQEADMVVFLSINDSTDYMTIQKFGEDEIPIFNLRRPLHFNKRNKYLKKIGAYYFYHHLHRPLREIVERFLSLFFSLFKIRQIVKKYKINVIHFMDNFGPSMRMIKSFFPKIKISYSPANYEPRGRFYNFYLKNSFSVLDRIFPLTSVYKNILVKIGLDAKKIKVIKWGIQFPDNAISGEEKRRIRKDLGCQSDDKLFLWTGYIQQIKEKDFYRSIQIAKRIVAGTKNVRFIFCFKPECYQNWYKNEESDRIRVLTDLPNFQKVLTSADFLFSPVGEINSTVSPPLTWIEAMALGTPVITTKLGGVEEIILNNKNGFISHSYNSLYKTVVEILKRKDLSLISTKAREFVRQNYNLKDIAKEYIDSWKEMLINEKP